MDPKSSKLFSPSALNIPRIDSSLYDTQINSSKKRARIDLSDSADKIEKFEKFVKKTKENVSPWTNKAYSQRYYEILSKRKKLPAWEAREQLNLLLKEHQVIILQGETGSGKTTQIPQFLLESGYLERFSFDLMFNNQLICFDFK